LRLCSRRVSADPENHDAWVASCAFQGLNIVRRSRNVMCIGLECLECMELYFGLERVKCGDLDQVTSNPRGLQY